MISQIASTAVFGIPLIMYGGILTLLLLLSTATVGYLNYHSRVLIPFKWHPRLAVATVIAALLHGFLGLSLFFNF